MTGIQLLKHQREFLSTDTKWLGMVAGYASGKTLGVVIKALDLSSKNPGFTGVVLEPTYDMCRTVLADQFDFVLQQYGFVEGDTYDVRLSPSIEYHIHWRDGTSIIRLLSAENYKRLYGQNLAWGISDEHDLHSKQLANKIFHALSSRLRVGKVIQGCFVSTPEGTHRWMYDFFKKNAHESDRKLIQASTYDNPHIDADFIPSLRKQYDALKIEAYLNGQFVNLTTATVYHEFSRELNGTSNTLADFPKNQILHVGMDFNVNFMSAAVCVVKDQKLYVIDEIVKQRDTRSMSQELLRRYPNRTIVVYPDSSSASENTKTALTDIHILKSHNFEIQRRSKNPPVADRVNSVNARLRNDLDQRHVFVNEHKCPTLVEGLDSQVWVKKGDKQAPCKDNEYNHILDGLGYLIFTLWPLYGRNKATVH